MSNLKKLIKPKNQRAYPFGTGQTGWSSPGIRSKIFTVLRHLAAV